MNLDKIINIHFIGIGGIGISAIARMMLELGKQVAGSDQVDSAIITDLKKLGASIQIGHHQENISKDTDLVIYSVAVPKDNPEIIMAEQAGLTILSYPQALGEIIKDKMGIAVSGTNGKTTVAAMIGLILTKANLDPTIMVGSNIEQLAGNFRSGQSDYVVVEACEYRAHMLHLEPKSIVLTNIEEDHLDFYKDLADIQNHFQRFVDKLDSDGLLVINNDDEQSALLKKPDCQIVTYGIKNKADLMAKDIQIKDRKQRFNLVWRGKDLGEFELLLPARFSVYNCLAATALCLTLGVSTDILKNFFQEFRGLWRRFEKIGEINQVEVYSDYSHHPTAIEETIRGFKEFYPSKRLVVAFQPHQHARTKTLFNKFIKSFDQADLLILNEIYSVPGREQTQYQDVSSQDLVKEIKKRNREVIYTATLGETKERILKIIKPDDILLIMGAGDIFKIGKELINSK